MNSKSKVPCIPIEGSISWVDWLKGRRARRESSKLVAPGVIRRKTSSSDRRLKKLFNGERGLPFTRPKNFETPSRAAATPSSPKARWGASLRVRRTWPDRRRHCAIETVIFFKGQWHFCFPVSAIRLPV
jgi:hypothetical protein